MEASFMWSVGFPRTHAAPPRSPPPSTFVSIAGPSVDVTRARVPRANNAFQQRVASASSRPLEIHLTLWISITADATSKTREITRQIDRR